MTLRRTTTSAVSSRTRPVAVPRRPEQGAPTGAVRCKLSPSGLTPTMRSTAATWTSGVLGGALATGVCVVV